jgi:hypothetical protein
MVPRLQPNTMQTWPINSFSMPEEGRQATPIDLTAPSSPSSIHSEDSVSFIPSSSQPSTDNHEWTYQVEETPGRRKKRILDRSLGSEEFGRFGPREDADWDSLVDSDSSNELENLPAESSRMAESRYTTQPSAAQEDEPKEESNEAEELISSYTCPICFCPPTNATLTPCGHICCGSCLFAAVKTTMQRTHTMAPTEAVIPRQADFILTPATFVIIDLL